MSWLSDLLKIFGGGRKRPPTPQGPAYKTRTVAIGGLPPGSKVELHVEPDVWAPTIATDGLASWQASAYLNDSDVRVTADGYEPYEHHVNWIHIPDQGDGSQPLNQQLNIGFELPVLKKLSTVTSTTTRTGIVRLAGRQFVDDNGAFFPLLYTLMWAYQGLRSEPDRFRANLKWMREHGADGIRMAAQVGWPGRDINPADAYYEQRLGATIDCAYDEFGLRTELFVVGGGLRMDPVQLASKVARVINDGRTHKIFIGEGANEAYNGNLGETDTISITRYMRENTPNLWCLSDPAPGSADDLKRIVRQSVDAKANVYSIHPDRGSGDNDWRGVRQMYDVKEFPSGVCVSEPMGPDSSVHEIRNPLQLACQRALGVLCGAGAHVFHVGSMVLGQLDPNHPSRKANVWEVDNIEAMALAVRDACVNMPEGVENWKVANTGWKAPLPEAPFQPDAMWPDTGRGINKAYSALSPDGRFVQLPIGVKDHVVLTAGRDCYVGAYDMDDNRLYEQRIILAGKTLTLPGRADTMKAYLLVGEFK